jgi:hypothetical protein
MRLKIGRPTGFAGRDDELALLAGLLNAAGTFGPVEVSAVAGLAGSGQNHLGGPSRARSHETRLALVGKRFSPTVIVAAARRCTLSRMGTDSPAGQIRLPLPPRQRPDSPARAPLQARRSAVRGSLGLLEEEVFDAVACNFGLGDTDHLYGALANVARLLRLVFCILHPCFPGAGRVSASWPTGGAYHGEAWWLWADELSNIRYKVGATHRTGLVVDRVAASPADRDWANERPGTARAPVYLVVRALRLPSPAVWLQ